jgi:hypothetical protein
MTSQPISVQPPRLAVWLIHLFTTGEEGESILGDLHEEFSNLASAHDASARSWYWRQAMKTSAHLASSGFRAAPWSTTAAVIGGFLLLRFVSGLPDKALGAITDRYLAYWSNHFKLYMSLATDGMLIAHFVLAMLVGSMVALAAKGRELVAITGLVVFLGALTVAAWLASVTSTGDAWRLLVQCADPFAILLSGVIIRSYKGTPKSTPSNA